MATVVAGNPLQKPLGNRRAERFLPTQVGNGGDHNVVQKQNSRAAQRSVDRVKKVINSHQMVMVSSQWWRSHAEN